MRGTICRLCSRQISANGLSSAKNEIKAHLLTEHKEEYLEFEKFVNDYQITIKKARDKILAKASELIFDPELITPVDLL